MNISLVFVLASLMAFQIVTVSAVPVVEGVEPQGLVPKVLHRKDEAEEEVEVWKRRNCSCEPADYRTQTAEALFDLASVFQLLRRSQI
ncbi:hypothetical protein PTTG_30681 [Puccinia triticina 1-1 BBBD Race 1]|uniref:Uncharacterized protein n=2 Tax=Puccinia triticina TaxID=208348 RepID=A0A180FYI2_PUCT1|nr:uncharacterized protein PtA15_12A439 [Puccinia triticina]OAV85229.1 hypothetical protein PTTG_30681 [Puccinia triticina 1-1 BBBD Race 1]WAQ90450.1 hypothetical protein PtA15_12A439 [Puccinia triticina]